MTGSPKSRFVSTSRPRSSPELFTNPTRHDYPAKAARLKALGFAYVGISLDGIGETHDKFRGRTGAFDKTVAAFRHLRDVDQKSGLANIDTQGAVHPDQFWQTHTLGNVKTEPFSSIWSRRDDALLNGLRCADRPLEGRCAECRFRDICGGGFRVRAWQRYGNPWAEDPGCHLSDAEICRAAIAA